MAAPMAASPRVQVNIRPQAGARVWGRSDPELELEEVAAEVRPPHGGKP